MLQSPGETRIMTKKAGGILLSEALKFECLHAKVSRRRGWKSVRIRENSVNEWVTKAEDDDGDKASEQLREMKLCMLECVWRLRLLLVGILWERCRHCILKQCSGLERRFSFEMLASYRSSGSGSSSGRRYRMSSSDLQSRATRSCEVLPWLA
jgi:hypothetical protein